MYTINHYHPECPPTRICSICGEQEYPDADKATEQFWICPDCCAKLKDIINPKRYQRIEGIMRYHD